MSYAPCKNPNCNSYGKPHPNCRCYDGMAEGGEAGPFCGAARAHRDGCEYFAGGGEAEGEVPEDDLPEGFTPRAAAPADLGGEVPEDDLPDQHALAGTAGEVPADDLPESHAQAAPDEANADLEPAALQKKMFDRAYPNGPTAFESPGQQLATVGEGLGRSQLGPVFTAGEVALGVPKEDIAARRAANPIESTASEVGGMLLPTSLVGKVAGAAGKGSVALGNLAKYAAGYEELGKIGAAAIRGVGEMVAMQASDEATKAILGHGNPADVVAPYSALGSAAILGAIMGGGGSLIGKLATNMIEKTASPTARYAEVYLSGMGSAARGEPVPEMLSKTKRLTGADERTRKAFADGYDAFAKGPEEIAAKMGEAARTSGSKIAGLPGWMVGAVGGKVAGTIAEPFLKKLFKTSGKYGEPTVLRWLGSGARGSVSHLENYVRRVERGESRVNNALDHVFKVGAQKANDFGHDEKRVESLKKWIDRGGMLPHIDAEAAGEEPEGFAKGGEATAKPAGGMHADDLHETMPEQAALLSAARGRISSYLLAQRPQPKPQAMPYDPKPDQRQAEKNYRQALEIGVAPLSIMKKIAGGSLLPRDLQHADAMYPELMGMLRKKATERVMKDQMDGKRPPYKVRAALSLFMGAPLESTFTPASIQAAQAVFAPKGQGQPKPESPAQGGASKGSKQSLSKSDRSYLTDDQARERRQQKV